MKKRKILFVVFMAVLLLVGTPSGVYNIQAAQSTTKTSVKKNTKKNGFYLEGKGKLCYYKNGKKIKRTWKTVKGKRYYFGQSGYACIGPCKVGSNLYLFKVTGALYTKKKAGFVSVQGNTYYVNKEGKQKTGWFSVGKYMYYADSKGRILKNRTYQGIKLDDKGRAKYSLDLETMMKTRKILNSITTSKMTKVQKLSVCYNYLARNGGFGYSTAYYPNLKASKWYLTTANRMLTLKRGNCYSFACAFAAFAKEIGYTPYLMCGRVPGTRDGAGDGFTRHCWVMINGRHYDPEGSFAGWGGCFDSAGFTTVYTLQQKVEYKY